MTTVDLLVKFLTEFFGYKDINVHTYELNGSKIEVLFSYNPGYEWDKNFTSYDNHYNIDLLDYMTWLVKGIES